MATALIVTSIILIFYLVLWRYIAPRLSPFGKKLVVVLSVAHMVLFVMHLLIVESGLVAPENYMLRWFFYYTNGEFNPPAVFASLQLLLVSVSALTIAMYARELGPIRLYWVFVCFIFLYLSADEFFMLHERFKSVWMQLYILFGGLFTLLSFAALAIGKKKNRLVLLLIVGGMGLSAGGAVGLEEFQLKGCLDIIDRETCTQLIILEELLEKLGILTVLTGTLIYAQQHVTSGYQRRTERVVARVGGAWAVIALAIYWVATPFAARFLATPIQLDYGDYDLSVVSYSANPDIIYGGDTVQVAIYWQTRARIPRTTGITAQLYDTRTDTVIARTDAALLPTAIGDNPLHRTWEWLPGVLHQSTFLLDIPADIAGAAAYDLTLTAWEDQRPDFVMQPIANTDRALLTADMARLTMLPILPAQTSSQYDIATNLTFGETLSLVGYSRPAEAIRGEMVEMRFGWRLGRNVEGNVQQFLHLISADGVIYPYDRPLLNDILLLRQWNEHFETTDYWRFSLPLDLPLGDYQVYTGLYNLQTMSRYHIDSTEEQIENDSLYVGAIRID